MAERINTDILVIGGSLAGMAAAITAKKQILRQKLRL